MRVLHIGASCGFGGAETVTLTLIREQKKAGIHVDAFFTADRGGAALFEDLCEVWFPDRYSLTGIILSGGYDVLHIDASSVASSARALKWSLYRGAVVITSHGWWSSLPMSDFIVAVSRFGAAEMQPYCAKPVRVIYNGVDTSRFYPIDRRNTRKPIAAWVGRASDTAKDSAALLAVCAGGLLDGFQITVVDGSTPVDAIGQAWLPEGSVLKRQLPWAEMPDLYRSVAESRGFLLSTSRVERCPMNILEAQACGCPVIAPAVGGIPELVLDRKTGFLYDRQRGPAAVREAIDWLYADHRWEEVSRAAAEHAAANFSAEKMHREYLAVYEEAVAAHHPTMFNRAAQRIMSPVLAAVNPKRSVNRKKRTDGQAWS